MSIPYSDGSIARACNDFVPGTVRKNTFGNGGIGYLMLKLTRQIERSTRYPYGPANR